MKWVDCVSGIGSITSLPVRGAWIEIIRPLLYILPILSLPVRGARIEMKKPKEKGRFRNGRSPCGERGLKLCTMSITGVTLRSRSPCGERGLKFDGMHAQRFNKRSLPVRGAWIEIRERLPVLVRAKRRSPCGERGLIYTPCHSSLSSTRWSLPVRGAWIEIIVMPLSVFALLSLPVRGAWIEMHHEALFPAGQDGRSPCGERGLKFKPAHDVLFAVVAPRAGSVD